MGRRENERGKDSERWNEVLKGEGRRVRGGRRVREGRRYEKGKERKTERLKEVVKGWEGGE